MPDIYLGSLEQGDILLLASDGLTGMVDDENLTRMLSSDGEPQHWVDRMITEAEPPGWAGQHHGDRSEDRSEPPPRLSAYPTTRFSSRFGTYTTFRTSFPSVNLRTAASRCAAATTAP